jgi:hypothetical protein
MAPQALTASGEEGLQTKTKTVHVPLASVLPHKSTLSVVFQVFFIHQ